MIELVKKAPPGKDYEDELVLTWEKRQKGRFAALSEKRQDTGVFIERGQLLREGDILTTADGTVAMQIRAASETLSSAIPMGKDPLLLAKGCYHLGNRHVPLAIADNELLYQPDHVLDDMLRLLGFSVTQTMAPFNPESGAYHSHGHSHGHHHD